MYNEKIHQLAFSLDTVHLYQSNVIQNSAINLTFTKLIIFSLLFEIVKRVSALCMYCMY